MLAEIGQFDIFCLCPVATLELEMVLYERLWGGQSVHLLVDHVVNFIQENEKVIMLFVIYLRSLDLLINFPNVKALSDFEADLVQEETEEHYQTRDWERGQVTKIIVTLSPQLALEAEDDLRHPRHVDSHDKVELGGEAQLVKRLQIPFN